MINVFKSGGAWKFQNKEYTVKAINSDDKQNYLSKGWVLSLDEVKEPKKPSIKSRLKSNDNEE